MGCDEEAAVAAAAISPPGGNEDVEASWVGWVVAESRLVSLLLFSDSGVAVVLVVLVVFVPVGRPTPPLVLLLSVAEVDAVVPITMILYSRVFTKTCFWWSCLGVGGRLQSSGLATSK